MDVGPVQILIVAVVILILFGRGRISEMMGDFGKGVKSFRQGMTSDDESPVNPTRESARLTHDASSTGETVEGKATDKSAK